jgi:hypothetical protein
MKLQKQIFLHLLEIITITGIIVLLSYCIEKPSSNWDWIERVVLCYGLYQFPTYLFVSSKLDSKKDMYLALLKNYRDTYLYLETEEERFRLGIEKNIEYQLRNDVFNDQQAIEEYGILKEIIKKKDKNYALSKITLLEHCIETVSLSWQYSILLTLVK